MKTRIRIEELISLRKAKNLNMDMVHIKLDKLVEYSK
jgi:hypothetical protein